MALALATSIGSAAHFAELTSFDGIITDGEGTPLPTGSLLPAGSTVVLERGQATITLTSGNAVCGLKAGASGAVLKLSAAPYLERGMLHVRAGKRASELALTFTTPHASATVVGTVFNLEVDDDTSIRVEEGSVAFAKLGMAKDLVMAGTTASTRHVHPSQASSDQPKPKPAIAYAFTGDTPLEDLSGGGLQLSANGFAPLFGTAGVRLLPGAGLVAIAHNQGRQAWQSFRDGSGITMLADIRFEGVVPSERILLAEVLGFLEANSTERINPVQLWFKPGPYAIADRTQRWAVSIDQGICRTWCDGVLVDQVGSAWSAATMHLPIHVKVMHLPAAGPCPGAWFSRIFVLPIKTAASATEYLRQ